MNNTPRIYRPVIDVPEVMLDDVQDALDAEFARFFAEASRVIGFVLLIGIGMWMWAVQS